MDSESAAVENEPERAGVESLGTWVKQACRNHPPYGGSAGTDLQWKRRLALLESRL